MNFDTFTTSMKNHLLFFMLVLFFLDHFQVYSQNVPIENAIGPPTKKKGTICLNMIVKDERHVIERCLASVLPFIDFWVIVDTGSTDGTQDVIKKFMKEKNIPGELHERSWVNFGYNREEALVLAKGKADYLLFIDADDVLSYPKDYHLPELIYDIYLIEGIAKEMRYHLLSIVKSSLDWHWHDPIHEFIQAPDARIAAILPSIQYIYMHDGARSKDPQIVLKDIELLKDCLAKSPDNPRYLFFLGQAYRTIGENEEALKYFKKRAEIESTPDEAYWAMIQVAHLMEEANFEDSIVEEAYLKAYRFRPSRHEAIYYLANRARERGDFHQGYEMASRGIELPLTLDTSNVEDQAYDAMFFEYAYNAYHLGKYKECIKGCNTVLKSVKLPSRFLETARKIRTDSQEKLRAEKVLKVLDQYSSAKEVMSNMFHYFV